MISLIVTVLNEKENISSWLQSILRQTILPDEIVVVDGGSTDGTWEWLQMEVKDVPLLRIFRHPGNIPSGRNFAITNAHGNVIAVADAGCAYESNWLQCLTAPLSEGLNQCTTTAFAPSFKESDGLIVRLIASATISANSEFKKDWLPSSRSIAFTRYLWQNIGGYPEWIPICEDIVFDLKIEKAGVKVSYIREPLTLWRPRTDIFVYCKQLYKYTKGDGHGKLWLNRQLIRYGTY